MVGFSTVYLASETSSLGSRQRHLHRGDVAAPVRLANLEAAHLRPRGELRDEGLRLLGADDVVPRDDREHGLPGRPPHARRGRLAGVRDHSAASAHPSATTEKASRSTCSNDSALRYRPAACSRTRPSSASTARVASLSSFASTCSSISLSRSARATARTTIGAVASIARQVARDLHGLLDTLLLVGEVNLRLGGRVAGVEDARLARLAGPARVDDGEDLPGRVQPVARQRPAHRGEEVERHEVQVLVQRLERRNHAPRPRRSGSRARSSTPRCRGRGGRAACRRSASRPSPSSRGRRPSAAPCPGSGPRSAPGRSGSACRTRPGRPRVARSHPVVTSTRDQPGNLSRYSRSTYFGLKRRSVHDRARRSRRLEAVDVRRGPRPVPSGTR